MSKPSYSELLQHPKWQKKRLAILDRAGFACEDCGAVDKTLHVHHGYYERGLKPWEYPDHSLWALCFECHQTAQDKMTELNRVLGSLSAADRERVFGFAMAFDHPPKVKTAQIESYECAEGFGRAFDATADEIILALKKGGMPEWAFLPCGNKRVQ